MKWRKVLWVIFLLWPLLARTSFPQKCTYKRLGSAVWTQVQQNLQRCNARLEKITSINFKHETGKENTETHYRTENNQTRSAVQNSRLNFEMDQRQKIKKYENWKKWGGTIKQCCSQNCVVGTVLVSGRGRVKPQCAEGVTELRFSFLWKRTSTTLCHKGMVAAKLQHLKAALQMPASMKKTCGFGPDMTLQTCLSSAELLPQQQRAAFPSRHLGVVTSVFSCVVYYVLNYAPWTPAAQNSIFAMSSQLNLNLIAKFCSHFTYERWYEKLSKATALSQTLICIKWTIWH